MRSIGMREICISLTDCAVISRQKEAVFLRHISHASSLREARENMHIPKSFSRYTPANKASLCIMSQESEGFLTGNSTKTCLNMNIMMAWLCLASTASPCLCLSLLTESLTFSCRHAITIIIRCTLHLQEFEYSDFSSVVFRKWLHGVIYSRLVTSGPLGAPYPQYVNHKHKRSSIYAVHAIQLCCIYLEKPDLFFTYVCTHIRTNVPNSDRSCKRGTNDLAPKKCSLALKKRKVYSEFCAFIKTWTAEYFFMEVKGEAVCLVCRTEVNVLKDYDLNCL